LKRIREKKGKIREKTVVAAVRTKNPVILFFFFQVFFLSGFFSFRFLFFQVSFLSGFLSFRFLFIQVSVRFFI